MLKINIHAMTSADFESTKPFSTSKITKKLCEHQIKRELIYNHSPFFYFINTKYTAATRQTNAAIWFQWSCCPWKSMFAITAKIISEITS